MYLKLNIRPCGTHWWASIYGSVLKPCIYISLYSRFLAIKCMVLKYDPSEIISLLCVCVTIVLRIHCYFSVHSTFWQKIHFYRRFHINIPKKRTPSKWWEMGSITYLLMFHFDIQIPLDIIPCLVWNTVSFHFIFYNFILFDWYLYCNHDLYRFCFLTV